MEDLLTTFERNYDRLIPVVCMNEKPVQLLGEAGDRLAAKPLRNDPAGE
jgi:hypothetical protein